MGKQLGVHAALADPARDQLRVLAAEVEHEDLLVRGRGRRDLDRRVDAGLAGSAGSPTAIGPRDPSGGRTSSLGSASGTRRSASLQASSGSGDSGAVPRDPFGRSSPCPTDLLQRCSCLPSVWSAGATITSARWKSRMSS